MPLSIPHPPVLMWCLHSNEYALREDHLLDFQDLRKEAGTGSETSHQEALCPSALSKDTNQEKEEEEEEEMEIAEEEVAVTEDRCAVRRKMAATVCDGSKGLTK